jgi:alpha-mannosidase
MQAGRRAGGQAPPGVPCDDYLMRISGVASTDLFGGTAARPLQIVRVTLVNDGPGMIADPAAVITVRVAGAGVITPRPSVISGLLPGDERAVEVKVDMAGPLAPGSPRQVTAIATGAQHSARATGQIVAAEPGWTMWMVSHFHYDPVWWSTQGQFTQTRLLLPGEDGSRPEVRTAFELVRLHLDAARQDPDYKFVLAELDYLKPHFDSHPEDREDLLGFIAAGRIEIVGGSYNEPNTNLTCAESTIRNAVYGISYQRDVLRGNPRTAWMLDAFGFDPSYPGLMAAAGMTESAWARGPFHQWGPSRSAGDNAVMQFASEFEWLSPDGTGLLTSYMPNHYSAGWGTQHAADLATAEDDAYQQFSELAPVAATRNVLLPVGGDHVIPSRWATEIHRDWNARYAWPRFVTAVPAEFFAAVREDAARRDVWLMPQTRDMNPVYTGKDVSYIDTKQAQRAAEIAVLDGERLATLAWLAGGRYPAASLDKAWRQLVFGAHHDAITGTEGDQVYLDLLAGWREAHERGDQARGDAAAFLAGVADTAAAAGAAGDDAITAIVVLNVLSVPRSGLARITLELTEPGIPWIELRDDSGTAIAFLAEGVTWRPDGTLAAATLTFRAQGVPSVGYRTYLAVPAAASPGDGWVPAGGTVIENQALLVQADPARGGTLSRILDKRAGTELLSGNGNELLIQPEYAAHPRWGEGPWLLCPAGPGAGSAGLAASVRAERCPIGSRLIAEFAFDDLRVTQETLLWDGAQRVEFRTHVDGSIGQDRLLRVRFPAQVPGGLPVYQTAVSVIGRPLGSTDTDVAEHSYTLDNPAHEWFGVGSTARVALACTGGERRLQAIGVAEVIAPAVPGPAVPGPAVPGPEGVAGHPPQGVRPGRLRAGFAPADPMAGGPWRQSVRDLLIALARQGVTATCSVPAGPRYGSIEIDSNLPDFRIALGGPELNSFTAEVLAAAGPAAAAEMERQLGAAGTARIWIPAARSRQDAFGPGADVRGARDLPVLIVAADDLGAAISEVIEDLADAVIEVSALPGQAAAGLAAEPALAGHSVALLNRGTPGSLVTPDGVLNISLMRSCSSWPSGIWIDGEKRTAPDGSSFAWQHWSHTFEYALAAGPGDWRTAGFPLAGQDYNHGLLSCQTALHGGPLPAAASLVSVEPPTALLMALKPQGNPLAPGAQPRPWDGVSVRLKDVSGHPEPVTAAVRLFTGLSAARATSICEYDGEPLTCRDGAAAVILPAAGTVTLAVVPAVLPAGAAPPLGGPARPAPDPGVSALPEPAQPVFTRYWLHGKGPAPAGNLPVAVHLSPGAVALGRPGAGALALTVACGPEPASGAVSIDVPGGLSVQPAGPLAYDLPAGGHAGWDLAVRVLPDAADGRYFVAARITDDAGQMLEDACLVAVGEPAVLMAEPAAPPPGLPLDQLISLYQSQEQAAAAEAELTLLTRELALRPGDCGEIAVRLVSRAASALRGEAQLVSPFGTWGEIRPWTQGFRAEPGGNVTIAFRVTVPATSRPGQHWWALVKVMYFGRLRYSEPVAVTISS